MAKTFYYSAETGGFYVSTVHKTVPADAVAISAADYAALLAGAAAGQSIVIGPEGAPVLQDPAAEDTTTEAAITVAVRAHLDQTAQALGYDDIATAVTYADELSVPQYQAEGLALRAWRSTVWATAYALLAEIAAGTRAAMTAAEVVAALPAFVAPSVASDDPILDQQQWSFLLKLTGFGDLLEQALALLPRDTVAEKTRWAALYAVAFGSSCFELANTLRLVQAVRDMALPGIAVPTDAEIAAAWETAAGFTGAAAIA